MTDTVSCPCCAWSETHALAVDFEYCPQCGELLRAGEVVA